MHVIVLLLTLFFAPINGQPENVKLIAVVAQDTPDNRQGCPVAAEVEVQKLRAADKTIIDIEASCLLVENRKDKAA